MRGKYLLLLLLFLFIIPFISANLGTFQQGKCVPIRVLANCSLVTLAEVTSPNQTYIINSNMNYLAGQTFSYSFCNTGALGTYTYSWSTPCVDCSQGDCGNTFSISPDGVDFTIGQAIMYTTGLVFALVIFFLFLYASMAIPFRNNRADTNEIISINNLKWLKIGAIALAYVSLMFIFGLATAITRNVLYSVGVTKFFEWLYLIMLSLTIPLAILSIVLGFAIFLNDFVVKKKLKRRHFR